MDKYCGNWLDDSVIREDGNGNMFIKKFIPGKTPEEVAVSGDCIAAFGGQGYGEVHELREISNEEYNSFGIKWGWGVEPWQKISNKTSKKPKLKTIFEMECESIDDLIILGIDYGYIPDDDKCKKSLAASLRTIYNNQHFKDPTDRKITENGFTVPLTLKALRGLIRQVNNDRDTIRALSLTPGITELPQETEKIKEAFNVLYQNGYVSIRNNKWHWNDQPVLLGYVINLLYCKNIPRQALSKYFCDVKSLSGHITASSDSVKSPERRRKREKLDKLLADYKYSE